MMHSALPFCRRCTEVTRCVARYAPRQFDTTTTKIRRHNYTIYLIPDPK